MRRLATLAVVAALISPTAASGQTYTFGDWARDQGYSPGDVMPRRVEAEGSSIDSLDGIGEFDWTTRPTEVLDLDDNQLTSIESGAFSGLTNLATLYLWDNQLTSIEPGAFSGLANLTGLGLRDNQLSSLESGAFNGLTNLTSLGLQRNQLSAIESGAFSGLAHLEGLFLGGNTALTELNLAEDEFLSLYVFDVGGNTSITSVSLKNTVLNQASFAAMLEGLNEWCGFMADCIGIGELDGITELDLSGIDFADITDLGPLYLPPKSWMVYEVMPDLTDLWLVSTQNLDASDLDILLDNLETIEGTDTEGILHMTQANFDALNTDGGGLLAAWDAEPGHHVEFLQIGDVNHDTEVNGLDVDPFVRLLVRSQFDVAADMNGDGVVNGLDVETFVAAVGVGTQQIPEPSGLLLALVGLGVIGCCRKWGG